MASRPSLEKSTGHDGMTTSADTFPLFPSIPAEIRVKIWSFAIKPRLIKICLRSSSDTRYALRVKGMAAPTKPEDERYGLFIKGRRRVIGKLFRVNRESRYEAQRFYRVRLPCWYLGDELMEPGILYFNPEYDFLQVSIFPPDGNDPTNTWLRYVICNGQTRHDKRLGPESPILYDSDGCLLAETLQRLREEFFSPGQVSCCRVEWPYELEPTSPPHSPREHLPYPLLEPIRNSIEEGFRQGFPHPVKYTWQRSLWTPLEENAESSTEPRHPENVRPRHTEFYYDWRAVGIASERLYQERDMWVVENARYNSLGMISADSAATPRDQAYIVWISPTATGHDNKAALETRRFNDLKECWPDLSPLHLLWRVQSLISTDGDDVA
ncbi:hypothetical protein F5Y10DRAFT_197478 [Nemania abortiva]|nr:hypothetical protein F5Y10DRAFT_197478 [Nemania abortiva]